jgi:hypothetical protein
VRKIYRLIDPIRSFVPQLRQTLTRAPGIPSGRVAGSA